MCTLQEKAAHCQIRTFTFTSGSASLLSVTRSKLTKGVYLLENISSDRYLFTILVLLSRWKSNRLINPYQKTKIMPLSFLLVSSIRSCFNTKSTEKKQAFISLIMDKTQTILIVDESRTPPIANYSCSTKLSGSIIPDTPRRCFC